MDIYTFQLGKLEHLVFSDIPLLDTTVKSGVWQLAPTWDMVMGVKSGKITPAQYTERYMAMLTHRYFTDPLFFEWLIAHEKLAVGCYCEAGKFCHRHLIVQFLSHITALNYCGEI